MDKQIKEHIEDAIDIAADAFQKIEDIKADLYDDILMEYDIPPDKIDDFNYYFEGLFEFLSVGGMVISAPGAPTLEYFIEFIDG